MLVEARRTAMGSGFWDCWAQETTETSGYKQGLPESPLFWASGSDSRVLVLL